MASFSRTVAVRCASTASRNGPASAAPSRIRAQSASVRSRNALAPGRLIGGRIDGAEQGVEARPLGAELRVVERELAPDDGENVGGDARVELGGAVQRGDHVTLEEAADGVEQFCGGRSVLHRGAIVPSAGL